MNEIWKPCPGFEGLYEVSSQGRVRGVDRYVRGSYGTTRFVPSQQIHLDLNKKRKYIAAALQIQNKKHTKSVHRLIAKAFHPNPNNLPEVNHKDGVRTNNAESNLEWCTRLDNIHHAQAIGLTPTKRPKTQKEKPPVLRGLLPKALELHAQGLTRKAISKQLGFSEWTITKHLKGKPLSTNRYTVRHEVTPALMQQMCTLRLEGKTYAEIARTICKNRIWVYRHMTMLE
jgi:NUMOD4 motif/HNH endonuclease